MFLGTTATSLRGIVLPGLMFEADNGGTGIATGSSPATGLEGGGTTPAATGGAAGAVSTPTDAARINALMSKWQTADGELTRLHGVLATAVAREAELTQQLADAGAGQSTQLTEAQTTIATLQTEVAGLTAQVGTLTAENTRLAYLVEHTDMIPYAAILPPIADRTALESVGTTIRTANQARQTQQREHLTTPAAGGSIPRTPTSSMSPAQISAYLNTAPPGEFEARLLEVTGRA